MERETEKKKIVMMVYCSWYKDMVGLAICKSCTHRVKNTFQYLKCAYYYDVEKEREEEWKKKEEQKKQGELK